jgi:hypothetical protein
MTLQYSNLNDRSPGWLFRLARRLLPGVGLVENEIKPYAEAWHKRNLEALTSADPLWVVLGDDAVRAAGRSAGRDGAQDARCPGRGQPDREGGSGRRRCYGGAVALRGRRAPRTTSTPMTLATRRSPPTSRPRSSPVRDPAKLTRPTRRPCDGTVQTALIYNTRTDLR